jgi:hypothetical protein
MPLDSLTELRQPPVVNADRGQLVAEISTRQHRVENSTREIGLQARKGSFAPARAQHQVVVETA